MTRLMRGKITGSTVRQIPSSSLSERALTVQFFDDDARVFDLIQSAGVDSNPAQNSAAFISDGGRPSVIATRDGITPAANPGEYEVYSTDSPATVKKARIKAKANGKLYLATVTGSTDLGTQLGNLMSALVNLDAALTALASALTTGTLVSMAAGGTALTTAMGPITTAINAAQTGIASVLDSAP